MTPFERFSAEAKRTLTLAQQEAEAKRQSYIGTEHLLLALAANRQGIAHTILTHLGVDIERVPEVIDEVRTGDERLSAEEVIPTSRVKEAIEIAFEEMRRGGDPYVGTQHLLLGLLIEGKGIGAHALETLGVTPPRVQREITRLRAEGAAETTGSPRSSFQPPFGASTRVDLPALGEDAAELLRFASAIATKAGAASVGLEHVVQALDDGAVWSILQLSARIRQAVAAREEAVAARDRQAADERRLEERRLREEHARAEAEWRRGLR